MLPFIKILAVFACMLAGIRFRIGLGTSIVAGGVALGVLFGMEPGAWFRAAGQGLIQEKTLFLTAIVGLILVLSGLLDKTGQAARLMDKLRSVLKNPRFRLAFFPALIGLLPMPGGAVFSAPMVKTVSDDMEIEPVDKVLINYWFRHIWECCWPLYPSIILAAALADMSLGRLVLFLAPGSLASVVLGWIFVLRPGRLALVRKEIEAETIVRPKTEGSWFWHGLPLLIAITGAIGLEMAISAFLPGVAYEWGILAALFLAIVCTMLQNRAPLKLVAKIVFSKHVPAMLYVILSIFVFKELLQRAGAVEELSSMAGGAMALATTAVILPFLVGMISGIAVAFVGATYPLMLGILAQQGLMDHMPAFLVLAWFAGFVGVMSSPMHICFILSCQYFSVTLSRAWRRLVLPCSFLLAFGGLYFLALYFL